MTEELLFEVNDGIGRVTFNRPAQRNALTWAMYDGLVEALGQVERDPSIRALIITGAGGKAFAAGTDIGQFRTFNSPSDAIGYEQRIDGVLNVLEACRVPTIAAIAGACTGGGAAIAAGGLQPRARGSASRSPRRSAIVSRWPTSPASQP